MKAFRILLSFLTVFGLCIHAIAQADSSSRNIKQANAITKDAALTKDASKEFLIKSSTDSVHRDSTKPVRKHDPRIATRRSAIIPGWGQAYNREYWKIPLVYGAISIPVVLWIYNNDWYHKTKFAYEARYKADYLKDSSDLALMDPQLVNLSSNSLQTYRNSFRRDRDYSVLFFLLAWGLNVVDATVFGHLKDFDVSNDLSMRVRPLFNPMTRSPGLTLTLSQKKPDRKVYALR